VNEEALTHWGVLRQKKKHIRDHKYTKKQDKQCNVTLTGVQLTTDAMEKQQCVLCVLLGYTSLLKM